MIGTVNSIHYTAGSLGQQYTTIDGVEYWTWFDLRELRVKVGKRVEYAVHKRVTHVGNMRLEYTEARILRVLDE